jgi:hypothetical protein
VLDLSPSQSPGGTNLTNVSKSSRYSSGSNDSWQGGNMSDTALDVSASLDSAQSETTHIQPAVTFTASLMDVIFS